jgi:hypothetical protein
VCWSRNARPCHISAKIGGAFSFRDWWMAALPDDMENCPSSTVSITVLTVKPVKFGKIFALASVEMDIDGVLLVIHGVQAIRVLPMGTRIDLPMFRDESGVWRRAITLPDEICGPIGKAVLDALVERGLAVRGPAM